MAGPSQQSATRPKRLPLLDGLRGIAAIGVMLYHAGHAFDFHGPFWRSYLFVDFFFLLSGFVLALSAEPKMHGGSGAMRFMRARIVRLWPMIAIGAVFGAIQLGSADGWQPIPLLLLLALLMIPATHGPKEIFPLNGPQWSLLLELLANLMHALLLRRLGQRGLVVLVALSGGALAGTILHFGSNTLGPMAHNWLYSLPRVVFAYSLGVWMARHWQGREHRQIVSWELAFALPVLLIVLVAVMPIPVAIGDAIVTLAGLPILFWLAALARLPDRAVPALDRLGAISFPLYAVHLPILHFYGDLGTGPALTISAIACALAVSMVLALAMESGNRRKPVQRKAATA